MTPRGLIEDLRYLNAWKRLIEAIGKTVDSLLTDTPTRRTPRVGPCLRLVPLFYSLSDGHFLERFDCSFVIGKDSNKS